MHRLHAVRDDVSRRRIEVYRTVVEKPQQPAVPEAVG